YVYVFAADLPHLHSFPTRRSSDLIGVHLPFRDVLGLVLVSYAPLVFAVLGIVPHLGLLWDGVLKVWMLIITIAGLNLEHGVGLLDRKSTRLYSSHVKIAYAVFWLK